MQTAAAKITLGRQAPFRKSWLRRAPARHRAVLAVLGVAVLVGCAASRGEPVASTVPTFDLMEQAFRTAHLTTPERLLTPLETESADIATLVSRGVEPGVPLLLPSFLPTGFRLAAPFRGTGSGRPLPNPHTWGTGYAVTYTDGNGRLTVVVGPDQELSTGPWVAVYATFDGRALRVTRNDSLVVVETVPDGLVSVAVVGERMPAEDVVRVAVALRPWVEKPRR